MTTSVEPTNPPAVPYFPAIGESGFNLKAFTFGGAMPAVVAWIAAAVTNAWNNAKAAFEGADAAVSAAAAAAALRDQVLAAAHFKDEWDKLAALPNPADRVLNKPACVKNDGRFWMLRVNLADVALSEPSDSNTDWTSLDAGLTPSAVITGDTDVVPGVRYIIAAPGLVLNIGAAVFSKGAYLGIREAIGAGTYTLAYGATKDRTRSLGNYVVTAGFRQLDRYYEDTPRGLM